MRLRKVAGGNGRWNWLFVPGGPGLGSESVAELARVAGVPGAVWLVDLPGDGSNRNTAAVPANAYERWPDVLAEAAEGLESVIMVGHSTGGMFILSVPELEHRLAGLVLVSSAPHAGWRPAFAAWVRAHPLPGVGEAADRYARVPADETLRALTLAAAPWSFTAAGLPLGRVLLEGLPVCHEAVAWADAHFDGVYRARWKPRTVPALIISGAEDHIIDQRLWQEDAGFRRSHIVRRTIQSAGHFPWVENPDAVRSAFADLTGLLNRSV